MVTPALGTPVKLAGADYTAYKIRRADDLNQTISCTLQGLVAAPIGAALSFDGVAYEVSQAAYDISEQTTTINAYRSFDKAAVARALRSGLRGAVAALAASDPRMGGLTSLAGGADKYADQALVAMKESPSLDRVRSVLEDYLLDWYLDDTGAAQVIPLWATLGTAQAVSPEGRAILTIKSNPEQSVSTEAAGAATLDSARAAANAVSEQFAILMKRAQATADYLNTHLNSASLRLALGNLPQTTYTAADANQQRNLQTAIDNFAEAFANDDYALLDYLPAGSDTLWDAYITLLGTYSPYLGADYAAAVDKLPDAASSIFHVFTTASRLGTSLLGALNVRDGNASVSADIQLTFVEQTGGFARQASTALAAAIPALESLTANIADTPIPAVDLPIAAYYAVAGEQRVMPPGGDVRPRVTILDGLYPDLAQATLAVQRATLKQAYQAAEARFSVNGAAERFGRATVDLGAPGVGSNWRVRSVVTSREGPLTTSELQCYALPEDNTSVPGVTVFGPPVVTLEGVEVAKQDPNLAASGWRLASRVLPPAISTEDLTVRAFYDIPGRTDVIAIRRGAMDADELSSGTASLGSADYVYVYVLLNNRWELRTSVSTARAAQVVPALAAAGWDTSNAFRNPQAASYAVIRTASGLRLVAATRAVCGYGTPAEYWDVPVVSVAPLTRLPATSGYQIGAWQSVAAARSVSTHQFNLPSAVLPLQALPVVPMSAPGGALEARIWLDGHDGAAQCWELTLTAQGAPQLAVASLLRASAIPDRLLPSDPGDGPVIGAGPMAYRQADSGLYQLLPNGILRRRLSTPPFFRGIAVLQIANATCLWDDGVGLTAVDSANRIWNLRFTPPTVTASIETR